MKRSDIDDIYRKFKNDGEVATVEYLRWEIDGKATVFKTKTVIAKLIDFIKNVNDENINIQI